MIGLKSLEKYACSPGTTSSSKKWQKGETALYVCIPTSNQIHLLWVPADDKSFFPPATYLKLKVCVVPARPNG